MSTERPMPNSRCSPTALTRVPRLALAGLLVVALLGGCSAGEQPRAAELVAPAQSSTDFGDLRVHYNALPSTSMGEAMSRLYGVQRDPGTALVLVAVRRVQDGEETGVAGEVDGVAFDLQGRRLPLSFQAIEVAGYTDHYAVMPVNARDSYRFEVQVRMDGRTHLVKFQRNF